MSVSVTSEAYPYLAIIGVVIILIFVCIGAASKSSQKKSKERQEKYQELQDMGIKFQYTLSLFSGLKIPEHTACKVSVYADSLSIEANGVKYILKNDRIKDICAKTDIDIQKHYVSSAGGAVLFGAVGAMIGGRVKEKTDRTIRNYLIVTYDKEGEPEYIAFDVTGNPEASKKLIAEYKGKTTQSVVEL